MQIHVSLAFAKLPVNLLPDFTTGVFNGLTKNATTFTSPPVALAALDAANKTLTSAVPLAVKGSVAQTNARDVAADVVIGMLRQLAAYVEDIAKGDEGIIALSGFQSVQRGPGPQQPILKTIILEIKNAESTKLLVRLNPQDNAYGYEGQFSTDGGKTWLPGGYYSQARRIILPNLIPGTNYMLRFRAIGASDAVGEWSDPVVHMAT